MSLTKKHTTSKIEKTTKTVVVTKTKKPASKSVFPKKLEKVNNILSKSTLLDS